MSSSLSEWPTSWASYYVVFLSAALALLVPLSLILISHFLSKRSARNRRHTDPVSRSPLIDKTSLGRRMNPRFFLSVSAALVLIAITLILIPAVVTFQSKETHTVILRSLVEVISLGIFSGLGLLYAVRKGDLSWLRSFRGPE